MLTLPFLATDVSATDAAKAQSTAPNEATDRQDDGSGFSDVFDEEAKTENDQPVDSDEKGDSQKEPGSDDSGSDDTSNGGSDTDDAAAEIGHQQLDLATVLKAADADKNAPTTRSAAKEASAFAKTIRALEHSTAAPIPAKPEQVVLGDAKVVMQQTEGAKVAQAATASAQTSGLAVEVADDLAPMRVQVRDTTSAGSAAVQANLQASQPASVVARTQMTATTQADADETGAHSVKVDATEEIELAPARDKTAPTPAVTQWRVQAASIEQPLVQTAASPQVNTDSDSTTLLDPAVGGRDEGTSRLSTSALDLTTQPRTPQATANPAYVVKQIADAVRTSDKNVIEITMDPPELGRLRLTMNETAGVMNITISTEQSATSDLMRRHIELLRRDFVEMGYDSVSFSFEQDDMTGQRHSEQPDKTGESGSTGSADHADTANADPETTSPQQQPTGVSAGLDIRL